MGLLSEGREKILRFWSEIREVMKVLPEVFCSGARRGGVDHLSPPTPAAPRELGSGLGVPSRTKKD